MDPLLTSLLDLLGELGPEGPPITIGGGFGLFLKRRHLIATGKQTLFEQLPEVRSTKDLDLFIHAEVLADINRVREVREAIRRLGCAPVKKAEFLKWSRPILVGEVEQEVKIDMHVGPLGEFRSYLHIKEFRARPKQKIDFHAHITEEAVSIEGEPLAVKVVGQRSDGTPCEALVHVPRAFPYLMMKLHAFEDRREDPAQDLGGLHALDLYTIVGLMTEAEYTGAIRLGQEHADNPHVRNARRIVAQRFADRTCLGLLRFQESDYFRPTFQVDEFIAVLKEVFLS